MVIILYALGATLCASLFFLIGAMWAAMPKLHERQAMPMLQRATVQPETESFKLAR